MTTPVRRFVIIGYGGLARELLDSLASANFRLGSYEFSGFVAPDPTDSNPQSQRADKEVFLESEFLARPSCNYFVPAVADPSRRNIIANDYEAQGLEPITFIHPSAQVSSDASIGTGSIVGIGSYLGPGSVLGPYSLADRYSLIGHDAKVDDFSTIHAGGEPQWFLAGCVTKCHWGRCLPSSSCASWAKFCGWSWLCRHERCSRQRHGGRKSSQGAGQPLKL